MRWILDDLYRELSNRYLNTSMLFIPYYYMRKNPKHDRVDVEALSLLSAIYDYQMMVHLIQSRFKALIDYLFENNIRLEELTDPGTTSRILYDLLRKRFSYFHRFDPTGLMIPWILRVAYETDLEEKMRGAREYDRALINTIWDYLYKHRSIIINYSREAWEIIRKNLPRRDSRSPLKRINLFLRWMVRREYPDLGLWSNLSPSNLHYPLGGEIARTAARIFLGIPEIKQNRKNMLWVTNMFRRINREDPVKYDFVLSRPPILGICIKNPQYAHCSVCPLRKICGMGMNKPKYNPLYSSLKEYYESKRYSLRKLREKHELYVDRTINYLKRDGFIERLICRSDRPVDHGLRPDIYCTNNGLILGEVKVYSHNIQGPHQLRVYVDEIIGQGLGKRLNLGILSYGKMVEGTLDFILEAIHIHRLSNYFEQLLILDFRGGRDNPRVIKA